jgi:hypothetical protein
MSTKLRNRITTAVATDDAREDLGLVVAVVDRRDEGVMPIGLACQPATDETLTAEPETAATDLANEFVAQIATCWQRQVEGIFETGRILIAAKESLPHGTFLSMIESQLPFGADTAQRLMAIARDERLAKAARGRLLPATWRTLYELTKLDDPVLDDLMADGVIRADMERKDIGEAIERRRTKIIARSVEELRCNLTNRPTVEKVTAACALLPSSEDKMAAACELIFTLQTRGEQVAAVKRIFSTIDLDCGDIDAATE